MLGLGELTGRRLDLEVSSWREQTVETGIRFLGTLENGSPDFATLVTVEVTLYDEAGALIDTESARLALGLKRRTFSNRP